MFSFAFAGLIGCQPMWEDQQKLKREARLVDFRAQMRDMERQILITYSCARLEYHITPGWML